MTVLIAPTAAGSHLSQYLQRGRSKLTRAKRRLARFLTRPAVSFWELLDDADRKEFAHVAIPTLARTALVLWWAFFGAVVAAVVIAAGIGLAMRVFLAAAGLR